MDTPNTSVEKHDLILYSHGLETPFRDKARLEAVEKAIEALERGETIVLLSGGTPTGTTMRAQGSRYVEEKAR